jgi:RHS repeat-associated protein
VAIPDHGGTRRATHTGEESVEQARFAYDPLRRRVEKVAAAATTAWAYDGEDILRETSPSTTVKYVHGPRIDEPLAREAAGVLTQFHADGLGSVGVMTDGNGASVATRRYGAFGVFEAGTTNGYAFTGREWDSETGLHYYRARYYDPRISRFINEDPIGLRSGDVNFYAYVQNRPTNFIDPFGLQFAPGQGFVTGHGFTSSPLIQPTCPPDPCIQNCLQKIMGTLPGQLTLNLRLLPATMGFMSADRAQSTFPGAARILLQGAMGAARIPPRHTTLDKRSLRFLSYVANPNPGMMMQIPLRSACAYLPAMSGWVWHMH